MLGVHRYILDDETCWDQVRGSKCAHGSDSFDESSQVDFPISSNVSQSQFAYHRAEYLEERARMMQWWADYLDGEEARSVEK
jgi:hypothetical protein